MNPAQPVINIFKRFTSVYTQNIIIYTQIYNTYIQIINKKFIIFNLKLLLVCFLINMKKLIVKTTTIK